MTLLLLLDEPLSLAPADVVVTVAEPDGPLEVGDVVRRTVQFRNSDTGALVDPGAVTAQVRNPYGATVTVTTVRASLGTYRIDVLTDMDGTWIYRLIGSSPCPGVLERRFTVQPTVF